MAVVVKGGFAGVGGELVLTWWDEKRWSLQSEGTVGGNVSQPVWRREIICNEVGQSWLSSREVTTVAQEQRVSAILLTCLGCLGVLANLSLMIIIAVKKPLSRWSQARNWSDHHTVTMLRVTSAWYIEFVSKLSTFNNYISTINVNYIPW